MNRTTYSVDGSCALAGYSDNYYDNHTDFSYVCEQVAEKAPAISLQKLIGILIKVLFLGFWAVGLFTGGVIGLFCVACGIIVLTITTFI